MVILSGYAFHLTRCLLRVLRDAAALQLNKPRLQRSRIAREGSG